MQNYLFCKIIIQLIHLFLYHFSLLPHILIKLHQANADLHFILADLSQNHMKNLKVYLREDISIH